MSFNIAIDGPAGAGKSTIAKGLASQLGFIYVDTGAMYRAIGLYLLNHAIASSDEAAIAAACEKIQVELKYEDNVQQVYLNGENVSTMIRKEEVGNMASATSGYPVVRAKLLSLQQNLAASQNVIMDGRDIGTCVLPNAQVKIYLTASVDARANRRFLELQEKGEDCQIETIKKEIEERDFRDMTREIAPLKQAEDAVLVDSSNMSIGEVIQSIYDIAKERGV